MAKEYPKSPKEAGSEKDAPRREDAERRNADGPAQFMKDKAKRERIPSKSYEPANRDNRPPRRENDGERKSWSKDSGDRPAKPYNDRSDKPSWNKDTNKNESRPPRRDGDKPSWNKDSSDRPARSFNDRGDKPSWNKEKSDSRPPRRDGDGGGERRSFNPNFTKDNKPAFSKERRDNDRPSWNKDSSDRPAKPYGDRGDKPSWNKDKSDSRPPRRDGDGGGERRSFNPNFTKDNKPAFSKERRDNDRPSWNKDSSDRPAKPYGDRGDKPNWNKDAGGDKKPFRRDGDSGPKRFSSDSRDSRGGSGPKKYGDKPSFEKKKSTLGKRGDDYPKYPEQKIENDGMRLNRYIAISGASSRREADELITSGQVTINGVVTTELGTKVQQGDEVRLDGKVLRGEKKVYIVMNKPKGYVTSLDDPHADKTVMDLLGDVVKERVYPVGRLDKASVGVLLITNDGDLTTRLTHPSYSKKKIYQVSLDKALTRADMDSIAEGIMLEDGEIHPDEINYVKENKKEIGIEIHSGRNRIVRRIFEHFGYSVTKLDRVYFSGLTKKNLTRGAWRFLTEREVDMLMSGRYE